MMSSSVFDGLTTREALGMQLTRVLDVLREIEGAVGIIATVDADGLVIKHRRVGDVEPLAGVVAVDGPAHALVPQAAHE